MELGGKLLSKVANSIPAKANWNIFVTSSLSVKLNNADIPDNEAVKKDEVFNLLRTWKIKKDITATAFIGLIDDALGDDESSDDGILKEVKVILGEIFVFLY